MNKEETDRFLTESDDDKLARARSDKNKKNQTTSSKHTIETLIKINLHHQDDVSN